MYRTELDPESGVPSEPLKFIDLFCGIGGFHTAAHIVCEERGIKAECVFASDIDTEAQDAYEGNYGIRPAGDITKIEANDIPDHDVLFAGFPCQAFSIIGDRKGFEDSRGTLFFDVARILDAKRPSAFVLENVKQLRGHDQGRTLRIILDTLDRLGYFVEWRILTTGSHHRPALSRRAGVSLHLPSTDWRAGARLQARSVPIEPSAGPP